ncbi:hypothetical protein D9756_011506 [Leucocoprinus leucothites]|uniref:Major facilitator superfamily (MFS) profile domain-containing protein n=1 Tax=Leucocoprinus leucothites TaxID=201217 RepID=A0A8H5FPE2_9AGAR|nr:hypothetical protein D9756_011506 [Leucoagaricus leucothites]
MVFRAQVQGHSEPTSDQHNWYHHLEYRGSGFHEMSTQRPEYRAIPDSEAAERETRSPLLSPAGPNSKAYISRGGTVSIRSDGSYNYSYGPGGLLGLKHNYHALLCAFFASIGGLEFGYDQGVIANVLVMSDFIHRWPVTPLQKGVTDEGASPQSGLGQYRYWSQGVLELSSFLAVFPAILYRDRVGRRSLLRGGGIVMSLSPFMIAILVHLFQFE